MFSFDFIWAFAALPLPLLVTIMWRVKRSEPSSLYVPFYAIANELNYGTNSQPKKSYWQRLLLCLAWLALVTAAARPIWLGEPINIQSSGRDLLLAVDISGSMEEQDMQIVDRTVRRIDAVKAVLNEFIDRRAGDRLGLVLFGSQAYLQSPLTFDRNTVKQLLNEAELGFAGKQTAIGDAIGLSVKRLQARPAEERVMILLTDGANTAGQVQPLQAAQLAEELKVKIYTIGMGADSMVVPGIFGSSFGARTVNPSRDLDEDTLTKIADQTGGRYFRARNVSELDGIYRLLDQLEPTPEEQKNFRPRTNYFHWPLALALLISMLLAIASSRKEDIHASNL